jgi:hypothetical protein
MGQPPAAQTIAELIVGARDGLRRHRAGNHGRGIIGRFVGAVEQIDNVVAVLDRGRRIGGHIAEGIAESIGHDIGTGRPRPSFVMRVCLRQNVPRSIRLKRPKPRVLTRGNQIAIYGEMSGSIRGLSNRLCNPRAGIC